MAYSTGTSASAVALRTTIENFATTNGFTLNAGAGSWLSKGQTHVKLSTKIPGSFTITRIGTTATVTMGGTPSMYHSVLNGTNITVSGASDANYNGTFLVINRTDTTFQYVMGGTPAVSPATGTIIIEGSINIIQVEAANSADGLTEPLNSNRGIYIPDTYWPITYHLFYNAIPDMLSVVLVYNTVYVQYIHFGDIVKINNSAYVGGNFIYGSQWFGDRNYALYQPWLSFINDGTIEAAPSPGSTVCIPFAHTQNTDANSDTPMHAEIDSRIWNTNARTTNIPRVSLKESVYRLLYRSPNTWNGQSNLVPMHLQYKMVAEYADLGYIEHLRLIRVDNYEINDIITIGSDTWKVFPAYAKNATYRNGGTSLNHTGTIGYAIRYTP